MGGAGTHKKLRILYWMQEQGIGTDADLCGESEIPQNPLSARYLGISLLALAENHLVFASSKVSRQDVF